MSIPCTLLSVDSTLKDIPKGISGRKAEGAVYLPMLYQRVH